LQAAILNIKLKYLGDWIEKRRKVASLYDKLFSYDGLDEFIKMPKENKNGKHSYYMYVVRAKNREKLQNYLKENGIESGIHYPLPLHLQPAYKHLGHKKGDFPITEKVSNEILSLPLYPEITNEQVDYVVNNIKKFYKN